MSIDKMQAECELELEAKARAQLAYIIGPDLSTYAATCNLDNIISFEWPWGFLPLHHIISGWLKTQWMISYS